MKKDSIWWPIWAIIIAVVVMLTVTVTYADEQDIQPPNYQTFPIELRILPQEFSVGIVRVKNDDGTTKDVLTLSGPINRITTEVFQFFADQYPYIDEVSLTSPGGLAYESFELGAYFSDRGLQTTVSPGRACLSACAIAFLGGRDYEIDGILGFHSSHITGETEDPEALKYSEKQGNILYQQGQLIGTQLARYLMLNGFHIDIALLTSYYTSPTKFLAFTNEDDLMKFYVRDDEAEVDPFYNYFVPLDDEVYENQLYLEEPQQWMDALDRAKAEADRSRQVVQAMVVYPLPENEEDPWFWKHEEPQP